MSELINNTGYRKERLKELILKLHEGEDPQNVRKDLVETLQQIPYGEVVEVEQELISNGLPETEVLRLCDVHGEVLSGHIDLSGAAIVPPGHPVDVFKQENLLLKIEIQKSVELLNFLPRIKKKQFPDFVMQLLTHFNALMDVDKHYKRKENLVFPFLEEKEITGPPKVMWGKHDEIREQLRGCLEILRNKELTKKDLLDAVDLLFIPVLKEIYEMTVKEEEILFPMCLDTLTEEEWWLVYEQTMDFGYTLYEPEFEWKPEGFSPPQKAKTDILNETGTVKLPSGSFSATEIMTILNTLPVDLTFVDKDDKVKYFTQGKERIFPRSLSIINRDVRLCHPPASVHVVEKILDDFKSGRKSKASFWIQQQGRFLLIEYYALRGEKDEYLGTLEVSQDLTGARNLEGEKRILSYQK